MVAGRSEELNLLNRILSASDYLLGEPLRISPVTEDRVYAIRKLRPVAYWVIWCDFLEAPSRVCSPLPRQESLHHVFVVTPFHDQASSESHFLSAPPPPPPDGGHCGLSGPVTAVWPAYDVIRANSVHRPPCTVHRTELVPDSPVYQAGGAQFSGGQSVGF